MNDKEPTKKDNEEVPFTRAQRLLLTAMRERAEKLKRDSLNESKQ